MSLYVWWDDSTRTTLFYRFKGEWKLSDIADSLAQRGALLDSAPHKVATVVDLTSCFTLPDHVSAFALNLATQQHHRLDLTLVVSPAPIMDAINVVLRKIALDLPAPVYFVKSLDAADAFLAEHRRPWWDQPTIAHRLPSPLLAGARKWDS